jgi:hypothetical protein
MKLKTIFLTILTILWTASLHATTFYIDSEKGVDTATGTSDKAAVKTMVGVDTTLATAKANDVLIIKGTPIWGVETDTGEKDEKGNPIMDTTVQSGIIQYHLIAGGLWRTVIEIGTTRVEGIATQTKDGMTINISKKEVVEVKPVEEPIGEIGK